MEQLRKRRYSNFHRARKWHRKFRNALYQGFITRTDYYSDLHDKYERKTIRRDMVKIGILGKSGDTAKLVILGHHDIIPEFVKDLKRDFTKLVDHANQSDSFLVTGHQLPHKG